MMMTPKLLLPVIAGERHHGAMQTKNDIRRSKKLSWLLRHGAGEEGLPMDAAGWAPVADVLARLRMSRAQLEHAVQTNRKRRLQLDGDRVRACQGHSAAGVPVTREALEATWRAHEGDAPIWHGTSRAALESIAASGLAPGRRTHVHLAAELESVVGKRAAVDVMLAVDPGRVRAAGVTVFVAPNGVILARRVPRDAIVGLEPMTKRSRRDVDALRAIFSFAS